MAPNGVNNTNDTHFKVALESPTTLAMSCDEPVDLSVGPPPPAVATAIPTPATLPTFGTGEPMVSWHGATTSTSDNTPKFLIGAAQEHVDFPIRVKVMKKRTVTVAVHSIASVVSGRADDPPDLLPTADAIKEKLNTIFGKQLNTYFEVRMVTPEGIPFDTADSTTYPGFTFDPLKPTPTPGNRVLDFRNWTSPEVSTATANRSGGDDIHVYVIGGATPILSYSAISGTVLSPTESSLGQADGSGANICVVDGDRDTQTFDLDGNPTGYALPASDRTAAAVTETIAHEIGHIMIKDGHPDEEGGEAPLFGTDRTRRLMCSGPNRAAEGHLLVKAEWDKAEAWLINFPDKRHRTQNGLSSESPTGNY